MHNFYRFAARTYMRRQQVCEGRMPLSKINAVAASIVLCAATAAFGDDNPLPRANETIAEYGEVEGWTVFSNKTRRNCYISRVFDSGAVQMGVTSDPHIGYLGVFTKKDIGIRNGKQSEIFVSIGGTLYGGVSTGLKGDVQGGYSGGYILTDSPEFKQAVAKQYDMIVFPETVGAFAVDLKGTYKAMEMGRECFKKQQAG